MAQRLFEDPCGPDFSRELDLGDAVLREYPRAFGTDEADRLLATLTSVIPWRQDALRIAGREVRIPRLQCWMGERRYRYSGVTLEPVPWHDAVAGIRERVEVLSGGRFNTVLLNLYRDGRDSVSWHADDERELGPNPVIASLSLGAERSLHLKHKRDAGMPRRRIPLRHGSLLLMGGTMQSNWLHQVPKALKVSAPRINLTFRRIAADPD